MHFAVMPVFIHPVHGLLISGEAAQSLGMTFGQMMRYVAIPRAFRRMLPPLGNNVISMLGVAGNPEGRLVQVRPATCSAPRTEDTVSSKKRAVRSGCRSLPANGAVTLTKWPGKMC
ncbi:hypothetical protein QF001_002736 [Paraburkholderia youngii]